MSLILDPLGPASLSQPLVDRVPLKFEHQRRVPSVRESTSSHDGGNGREPGQGQNPSLSSQYDVNGEPLHDRSSEEERLSSPEQQANRFLDNLAEELSNRPNCPPPGPSALEANRLQQLESSTTQNPTRLMLTGAGDRARGVQTAVDHSSDDLPGATSVFQSDQVPQQATHPRSNHHQRRAPSGVRASYDDFWNGYDDEVRDLEEAPPSYPDSQARQQRLEEEARQRRLEEEARQRKEREAAEKKRQEEAQAGQASGSQGARKLSRSERKELLKNLPILPKPPKREL
ncbi:hypothetical protein FB446DRAFT_788661 [Lentinula raphanica]|nr:hypothetical protein FB446DRAFT_788661 [Lentinula raphanica]